MNKYNSSYTEEQFETAIDLLENTWTQLEFINGQEGQDIIIFLGKSIFVANLMASYLDSDWKFENSTGGLTDASFMLYPNYNKLWVRSYNNSLAQSSAKCKIEVEVTPGHMYYLSAVADGIVSNENLTSNVYNQGCNRYGISLEKTDVSNSVANVFAQDLNVHTLSCIGQIPANDNDRYVVSLYSNKDTDPRDAIVYFGCITLVDLTEAFGTGNEPDKEWCDNYLKFYNGTNIKDILQIRSSSNDKFLYGTFDSRGKCVISVPGFGYYTAVMFDQDSTDQNIVYYNNILVNKIKRYTINLDIYSSVLRDSALTIMLTCDNELIYPVGGSYTSRYKDVKINDFVSYIQSLRRPT